MISSSRRASYTNSFWRPPAVRPWHDHKAAKKKPNPSASEVEAPPLTDNALVPTNNDNNEDHSEDFEVEDLADGDFEVDLHDLGISTKDIQVMKRIDARLSERLRHAQQAQAGTSNTPVAAKVKGKGHELTAQELEEQLNKLREEELWHPRCLHISVAYLLYIMCLFCLKMDLFVIIKGYVCNYDYMQGPFCS